MKPIYELVTAAELKVGDVVRDGSDGYRDFTVHNCTRRPADGEVTIYSVSDSGKIESDDFAEGEEIFRRIPATEDPRVLRRAFENLFADVSAAKEYIDECIEQARKQLESEALK